MPVTLPDPETGGAVEIYHGDPFTMKLVIDDDLSSRTFKADIRPRPSKEVLTTWTVNATYDPSEQETTIVMSLTGDSGTGSLDGQTRLIPKTAVTDLQEIDTNGVVVRTLAKAVLTGIPDVTR